MIANAPLVGRTAVAINTSSYTAPRVADLSERAVCRLSARGWIHAEPPGAEVADLSIIAVPVYSAARRRRNAGLIFTRLAGGAVRVISASLIRDTESKLTDEVGKAVLITLTDRRRRGDTSARDTRLKWSTFIVALTAIRYFTDVINALRPRDKAVIVFSTEEGRNASTRDARECITT